MSSGPLVGQVHIAVTGILANVTLRVNTAFSGPRQLLCMGARAHTLAVSYISTSSGLGKQFARWSEWEVKVLTTHQQIEHQVSYVARMREGRIFLQLLDNPLYGCFQGPATPNVYKMWILTAWKYKTLLLYFETLIIHHFLLNFIVPFWSRLQGEFQVQLATYSWHCLCMSGTLPLWNTSSGWSLLIPLFCCWRVRSTGFLRFFTKNIEVIEDNSPKEIRAFFKYNF